MEKYYKADAVITAKPVEEKKSVELTQEIKDKILALKDINEETVRHVTATSRAQARIWLEQLHSESVIKTEAEILSAKEE